MAFAGVIGPVFRNAAVLACVPFALPFGLDDSAVCQCCPPASAADLLSPERP